MMPNVSKNQVDSLKFEICEMDIQQLEAEIIDVYVGGFPVASIDVLCWQ